MPSVLCHSCRTVLPLPENWPAGEPVTCPLCACRFRVGNQSPPADRASATYWDQVPIDEMLAGVVGSGSPAHGNERPSAAPPSPVPAPLVPTKSRWGVIAATAASLGLLVGLVIALSPRVRTELKRAFAPTPPLAVAPEKPQHPSSTVAPAPPTLASNVPSDAIPPAPQPSNPTPQPPQPPAWPFDQWLQDFDQARVRAKEQRKDVLLVFDASDGSDFSRHMAVEVFARPDLWNRINDRFIPVHIDFPQYPRARRRVQDPERNEALQARFFKNPSYPRVVMTDAEGRPYAIEWGYESGQAEKYVSQLEIHRQMREDRDDLLAAVEEATGDAKLRAAEAALSFLAQEIEAQTPRDDGTYTLDLAEFYSPLIKEWRALADAQDPANGGGYRERFFFADWGRRSRTMMSDTRSGVEALRALAGEFDAWRSQCHFKNPDLAADLLSSRAELHSRLGDPRGREREVKEALSLNLSPERRKALVELLEPETTQGMGTGFAVAPGYFVTNYHVVQGTGPVRIRIQGQTPLQGTILAHDEDCDLALLKVELPPRVTIPPLRIAPRAPSVRGTEVMALGYAMGGESLKFTRGAVSARHDVPGSNTLPLLVLDQRVNPGNSGGPLFDASGNVLGIVTAKTTATSAVDSYGIAVASEVLDRFLSRHLKQKEYRALPPLQQKLDWAELDRRVNPSVVLVLKDKGS